MRFNAQWEIRRKNEKKKRRGKPYINMVFVYYIFYMYKSSPISISIKITKDGVIMSR